jgi:hypothetical protein
MAAPLFTWLLVRKELQRQWWRSGGRYQDRSRNAGQGKYVAQTFVFVDEEVEK